MQKWMSIFTNNKQKLRLNREQTPRLRHPCQKVWRCYIQKPNIVGTPRCCCGVAGETVKPHSQRLRRVSRATGPIWVVCLTASVVCALIWPTYRLWYVDSCGNARCINQTSSKEVWRKKYPECCGEALDLMSQCDANARCQWRRNYWH